MLCPIEILVKSVDQVGSGQQCLPFLNFLELNKTLQVGGGYVKLESTAQCRKARVWGGAK